MMPVYTKDEEPLLQTLDDSDVRVQEFSVVVAHWNHLEILK